MKRYNREGAYGAIVESPTGEYVKWTDVVALLAVIADVHHQHADDLCWMDIDRIFIAAGYPVPDRSVGDKCAMLANCKRYIETMCQGGKWKSYAELEAELEAERSKNMGCDWTEDPRRETSGKTKIRDFIILLLVAWFIASVFLLIGARRRESLQKGKMDSWAESAKLHHWRIGDFSRGVIDPKHPEYMTWKFSLDLRWDQPELQPFPCMVRMTIRPEVQDEIQIGRPDAMVDGMEQPVSYHRPSDDKDAQRYRCLIFDQVYNRQNYEILVRVCRKDKRPVELCHMGDYVQVGVYEWNPIE